MKYRVDVIRTLFKQVTVEADSREAAEKEATDEADYIGWDVDLDFDRTEIGSFIPLGAEQEDDTVEGL